MKYPRSHPNLQVFSSSGYAAQVHRQSYRLEGLSMRVELSEREMAGILTKEFRRELKFDALTQLHGERSRQVLRRLYKLETERRTDAYYSVIVNAMSQLPRDDPAGRQRGYDLARALLSEHFSSTDLERERRALEEAIRRFERTAGGSE
jgi:hypothetical protein